MATTDPAKGNLYLIGFSYTGKTTVGRVVAQRLDLVYVDTDIQIELRQAKSVPEIFADEGEAFFRDLETQVLRDLSGRSGLVVATGGGMVQDPANRRLMAASGAVICLDARPETILSRMHGNQAADADNSPRPLIAGPNPLEAVRSLKARRQRYYALGDWTVHTDTLTLNAVATEVVRGAEIGWRRLQAGALLEEAAPSQGEISVAYVVRTETSSYPIVVGAGILPSIGAHLKELGFATQAHLITDTTVASLLGETLLQSLHEAGIPSRLKAISPGEASKTLAGAEALYDWLAQGKAERRDVIIGVGGGVVGDLAGFVAATYARGLALVQVPTTLLAMADASIGGKVAIDLPVGKNLVGAFHQPSLVLADVHTLATLPTRERVAGWAEVIKTALIFDVDLVDYLESHSDELLSGNEEALTHAIARCAAIKGRVVSLDERETSGLRACLNYGHTLGHALEAAANYTGLLHGEAVAIGMTFAGELAQRAGLLSQEDRLRQERLFSRFGLPSLPPADLDPGTVYAALSLDKKTADGRTRWVLLDAIGASRLHGDIPQDLTDDLLKEFLARSN